MNKFLFILAFFASSAYSASFDCSKASSITEKTICNNPTISLLDDKLGATYKSAMGKTNDQAKLKADQIAWIKESRLCGGDSNCLEKSYKGRIAELSNISQSTSQAQINSSASKANTRQQKIQALNSYFGPSGWGRCMAGQISMSAMIARGDPLHPSVQKATGELGDILGAMRQVMLAEGVPQAVLDSHLKGWGNQIRTGDAAFEITDKCLQEVIAVNKR